jgi:hypothetical protein
MSTDRTVANSYTIVIDSSITDGIKTYNFIDTSVVTLVDPCLTSTWVNTISFANITTTVNFYPPFT